MTAKKSHANAFNVYLAIILTPVVFSALGHHLFSVPDEQPDNNREIPVMGHIVFGIVLTAMFGGISFVGSYFASLLLTTLSSKIPIRCLPFCGERLGHYQSALTLQLDSFVPADMKITGLNLVLFNLLRLAQTGPLMAAYGSAVCTALLGNLALYLKGAGFFTDQGENVLPR